MGDRNRVGRASTLVVTDDESARPATDPDRHASDPDVLSSSTRPGRRDGAADGHATWRMLAARTRPGLVIAYLLLLIATGIATTVGLRLTVERRLHSDVDAALGQEVEELRAASSLDPRTGAPYESVRTFFEGYDEVQVPSIEEAFVSYVDGELVRERVRSFPLDAVPDGIHRNLGSLSLTTAADVASGSEIAGDVATGSGDASYRAVVFDIGGERGVYAVVILPAARFDELRRLQWTAGIAVAAVVAVAGACARLFTGRVLRSMKRMTATARAISDPDASLRLPVSGGSEAEEMAETVNAMLDRLRIAHRAQWEFLHAAGHELRSPLTVVSGHLDLLEVGEGAHDEVLPVVRDEVARMGRIVDDLQSLAASESPDFVRLGLVDAGVLVHELIGKARSLGDRGWTIDDIDGGVFVGDRHRITQAVLNLADNAVRHTEVGEVIAFGASTGEGVVRLWVRDAGVGVQEGDEDIIFDRFVRGRRSIARYRGSGLGLTIVASIAAAHGGRVEHSPEHPGARFTLVLPVEGPSGTSTEPVAGGGGSWPGS